MRGICAEVLLMIVSPYDDLQFEALAAQASA